MLWIVVYCGIYRMNQLVEQIKALEEKLLHADMQANPLLLDALLAEEFEEIDGSGVITSRQEAVNWLLSKNKNDRWLLSNFRVKSVSLDIVQAIYQVQKIGGDHLSGNISTRSSIWKRQDYHWKIVFHQASASRAIGFTIKE